MPPCPACLQGFRSSRSRILCDTCARAVWRLGNRTPATLAKLEADTRRLLRRIELARVWTMTDCRRSG